MRKGKGRNSAPPTPARPIKHTLHFLLHGEGNETVHGTLVLDNFPLNGDMGVGGLSTPVQSGEQEYDEAGASVYAIVVIAVYGFSIVMLIASHIFLKKKADKRDGGDEKQIDKYLAQVPILKEKSKRDSFRRLKKSIIPLLSVGMANDITAIAAGPLGHTAFQRHMDLLDQQRIAAGARSPSRSPSMGRSTSALDSPPGGSPRTLSPSLDDSSGEDYDDSVKVDMPLERDRSFDRVSQSRMPIIVEIDEVTDSPTAQGRQLPSTSTSTGNKGQGTRDPVAVKPVNPDCSVNIEMAFQPLEGRLTVSPWEEDQLLEGAAVAAGDAAAIAGGQYSPPGGPGVNVPSVSVPHSVPHGIGSQRVKSPRRCHPSELSFDFPERKNTQQEQPGSISSTPTSSEDSRDYKDSSLSEYPHHQHQHSRRSSSESSSGSGKRGSLQKWTPVGSVDRWKTDPNRSQRSSDEEEDLGPGKQPGGIQITFV